MSLRRRVAVVAAVAAVIVVVLGVMVASRFADAVSAGTEVFTRLEPAADEADRLVQYRVQVEGDLQDYVMTGDPQYLDSFTRDLGTADDALAALRGTVDDALIERAEVARSAWWDADAGPSIALVASGRRVQAQRRTQSDAAWAAYDELIASATAIQDDVDSQREAVFASLALFTRELFWALLAAGAALLGLVLAAYLMLGRWVLTPLDSLRRQLRSVARRGEHDVPIQPSGPPELYAAGSDAEQLRRQLVAEIDEARAAREGLAQGAPVVAAIERELRSPRNPVVAGLRLHGEVQAAEGVVAGDWWDCVPLPAGGAAVVVTDVSGHGPDAGIAAMRLKGAIRPVLESGGDGAAAITAASGSFEDAQFATVVVVRVDPTSGTLHWANAGHHPPLILRSGGDLQRLEATGPLLSGLGGTWTEQTGALHAGDVLVAYTDGLVESRDAAGAELGEDGLRALLSAHRTDDPDELVTRVVAAARSRSVDWHRDDVTVVALTLG